MNGNSNISKEMSAHAAERHLLPRWRIVFIALCLVLIIGSVSQTPAAQAAPVREGVTFYMDMVSPKTTVCVGKTVSYEARVYMVYNTPVTTPKGNKIGENAIAEIKVEANSQDMNVGDFLNTKKGFVTRVTGGADDLVSLDTGESSPNTAVFAFKAKKAGKTNLYFQGLAYGQYVSFTVPVKVIPCKFKVKVLLRFNPGIYNITVISDEVVMTADEAGTFTGSAVMHWVYSNFSIPCSVSAPDSSVNLTGKLDDDGGKFVGTVTFGPTTPVGCRGSGQGAVNPLKFSVRSSGGVSKSTATASPLSGPSTILVVPVPIP